MTSMTSMERVLATVQHKRPDRTPLMLLLSLYGAKEAGMAVDAYFADPKRVAATQLAMQRKYSNDLVYGFHYAAAEVVPFGMKVSYGFEGPPNAGEPGISSPEDIDGLSVPDPFAFAETSRVFETIEILAKETAGEIPVVGVVISPFSLPVMQMGFGPYLKLLYKDPVRFERLMQINSAYCKVYAAAQVAAGASAICYFNPLASTEMIEEATYALRGAPVDRAVIASIDAPVIFHLASARSLDRVEDAVSMGAAVLGISDVDDVEKLARVSAGRMALLGSLNTQKMVRWHPAEAMKAVEKVRRLEHLGASLLLSDHHGEIPWQVSEEVLLAIGRAARL